MKMMMMKMKKTRVYRHTGEDVILVAEEAIEAGDLIQIPVGLQLGRESNVIEVRCDELLEGMPGQPDVYRPLSRAPKCDEIVYKPGMGKLRVADVAKDGVLCTLFLGRATATSGQGSEGDDDDDEED